MIAYYPYAEGQPDKSKFPSGTQFVTIDNTGSHTDCDVVDFEAGAMETASAVVAWLKKRPAATRWCTPTPATSRR